MLLCKKCAIDYECYYYFLYPYRKDVCDCCHELRVCFYLYPDDYNGGGVYA